MLLYITRRAIRSRARTLRLWSGAALGALYAIFAYFPSVAFMCGFLGKLLLAGLIVYITYGAKTIKEYLSGVAVFYMASFAFGGAVYALMDIFGEGDSNASLKLLTGAVALSFVVITAITRQYARKVAKERHFADITATLFGKQAAFRALTDTGHSLTDPISGGPVIIAQLDAVDSLLPKDYRDDLQNGVALPETSDDIFGSRIKLIPFRSLGQDKGMLPGFRPDSITADGISVEHATIAIYKGKISSDDTYSALIGPQIALNVGACNTTSIAKKGEQHEKNTIMD